MKEKNDRLAAQGDRLRKYRESQCRSAEDVASLLGMGNRQSVYDLEGGKRDLKAYEALQLAEYYGVSPEVLLNGASSSSQIFWRGESDNLAENLLRTRLERYERLLSLAECSVEGVMPCYDLSECNSYEQIEGIAEGLACQLKLGRYPARVLEEVLWKTWNVIVFHVPLESGSGACIRGKGLSAVLLNSDEVWWRRNFSLGHEVFHLVFNNCRGIADDRVETMGNIFASHLLMPAECINEDFRKISDNGSITYFDLMSLAKEFMVSTEALLWRLCRVGIIEKSFVDNFRENDELKNLDKDVRADATRKELSLPVNMVSLAYRVYLRGNISVGKLAEYLETTVDQLKTVLRSHGIDPFAEYYETSLGNT